MQQPHDEPRRSEGDWSEYRRWVVADVAELKKSVDDTRAEVQALRSEVTALRVKAGVWGFAAGLLPALAAGLFFLIGMRKP